MFRALFFRHGQWVLLVIMCTLINHSDAQQKATPAAAATRSIFEDTLAQAGQSMTKGEVDPAKPAHQRRDKGNIALLNGDWGGQDRLVIDTLAAALRKKGCGVTMIDADAFLNPQMVTPERFDLFVVTGGRQLPVELAGTLKRYLDNRGHLLVLGTPLFAEPHFRLAGRWTTAGEIEARLNAMPTARMLYDFESGGLEAWSRESNDPSSPVTLDIADEGAAGSKRAMHVKITNLTNWETFASPALAQDAVPPDHSMTCFWAKGGPRTTRLAVGWKERDGSRWIATVPLTTQWRYYVLPPGHFPYWHDSATGDKRGKGGDRVNPANGGSIRFGLALSHTGPQFGDHEFWIDQVGVAPNLPGEMTEPPPVDFAVTDLLWPAYKCYLTEEIGQIRPNGMQAMIGDRDLPIAQRLCCPHQRPQGTGFNKGRAWRMITVVEALGSDRAFRGPALAMLINQPSQGRAHAWATLGSEDATFLTAPETVDVLVDVAERMIEGLFLLEGGSEYYTYFQGEKVRLGARVVNTRREGQEEINLRFRITAGADEVFTQTTSITARAGDPPAVFECTWGPERLDPAGYTVVVELVRGEQVIDRVVHELGVWEPKASPQFVEARDGDFYLDGRKWYAFGVNHMPSSGIGFEDKLYFEQYLSDRSYDPDIFDRELGRIRAMGMNMVSAFIYHGMNADRNLVDYLRRCEKHGLKVNLSLRPGTPMDFAWPNIRQMIVDNRLAENDTVFAYDLAWEPFIGRHAERTRWDPQWGEWVKQRYGSIENAEQTWSFAAPRNKDGHITNPTDAQCGADGPWRKQVADYRRFIDELVDRHYREARRLVRSVDPNHLVSFRMTMAGDPTLNQSINMPYDFRSLINGVDIFEPEGYGRLGDWERIRPGLFTVAYARAVDPTKPVMWAEFGMSAWDRDAMESSSTRLESVGRFYEDFLKMVMQSGANGAVSWWYPGGFRVNENSDYGIINCDGTDRPATKVIREFAPRITRPREIPKPDVWIEYDPDHPAGIEGIYKQVGTQFWEVIDAGKIPGLRAKKANRP